MLVMSARIHCQIVILHAFKVNGFTCCIFRWVLFTSEWLWLTCCVCGVIQSTGSAGYGSDGLPTSTSSMYDAHMR